MSQLQYQSGWGNFLESEAVPNTLPQGQNSPRQVAGGLYAEQLSGTAFTMSRHENLRSWLYRLQPSVVRSEFQSLDVKLWQSRFQEQPVNPTPLRWGPLQGPSKGCDFVDGVVTMASTNRSVGVAIHHYIFNQPMTDKYFYNADGEMLFVPEQGGLVLKTEFGILHIEPGEIAVVPRGVHFQVLGKDLDSQSKNSKWYRGYVAENSGAPFRLPDLGPLGANGLAHPRDFLFPVAHFEDRQGDFKIVCQFGGQFWQASAKSSPLNVVAWHGNYVPYKYDLRRFNTMGSVSYDHPDPSIYTVLTSPSSTKGMAHCDLVVFPPRWLVAEETFRPPYFHRNLMNEYMGLIYGAYDAKEGGGFVPGGASLHNCMSPHGPDSATYQKEVSKKSSPPAKVDNTMAFMLEANAIFQPSEYALKSAVRDKKYIQCWQDLAKNFEA